MSDDCEHDDADDDWYWLSRHYEEDYEDPSDCPLAESTWSRFPDWSDLFSAYVRFRLVYQLLHSIASDESSPTLTMLRHCSDGDRSVVMGIAAQRSVPAAMSELQFCAAWYNSLAADFAAREHRHIEAVQAELRATYDVPSNEDDDDDFFGF